MNRNSSSQLNGLRGPAAPAQARAGGRAGSRRAAPQGVALVITLIMLSIITVITITILAIVRRDRAAVTQAANLTDARLAADAALERAKAEMVAQILASTNLLGFDLTVSRSMPSNVADLFIDPRVPVFVDTNRGAAIGPLDPRFFLDLNRNDQFDDSILTNGVLVFAGDPQWIGLLEKPYRKHDANNRFVGRFAFLVVPCGKTLDVNWIHNSTSAQRQGLGFFRNQGFGPWEINLAAFLADLRPEVWSPAGAGAFGYRYGPFPQPIAGGLAFSDAKDILLYRYAAPDMRYLPSVFRLYGTNGSGAFLTDLIDGYNMAPAAMGVVPPLVDTDRPSSPWVGANSVRHYFSHQDFFDGRKVGTNFINHLRQTAALTNGNYTFYQLLSQLGTDSGAEDLFDKIHINYVTDPNPSNPIHPTNFLAWDSSPERSVQFLVKVAERLFQEQFFHFNPEAVRGVPSFTNIVSVTNVQVSPTNHYSPALHRLYQVAANIYDATHSNVFPSVFRPLFTVVTTNRSTNVYLTGFTNDNRRSTLDAWLASSKSHGIPLVVGARKGFPNFNEYTFRTDIQFTRKLEFYRPSTNAPFDDPGRQTNQMYLVGISNLFGAEAWNSYQAPYPRPLTLEISDTAWLRITNQAGLDTNAQFTFTSPVGGYALPAGFWQGKQFILPLYTNAVLIQPSAYRFATRTFDALGTNVYETGVGFPLPEFHLSVSNQFIFIVSDGDNLVDFVLSQDMGTYVDIDRELMDPHSITGLNGTQEGSLVSQLWDTNRVVPSNLCPSDGIMKQVDIAIGNQAVDDTTWKAYLDDAWRGEDKTKAIAAVRKFLGLGSIGGAATNTIGMTSLRMQAPFCPTRKFLKTCTWQANDPLVHYHMGDLMIIDPANPSATNSILEAVVPPRSPVPTNMSLSTLGALNGAYSPWGGNPNKNSDPLSPTDPNARNAEIKDPGVRSSDDWDFPQGKFPSVGWLGRVHRGSPWQTVFFKPLGATEADESAWRQQSADCYWYPPAGNQTWRYLRAHPTNDWVLADLFTTATDENSTRGLLSINQTNLAAWSAVLSGVVVLKNPLKDEDVLSINTNAPIPLSEQFIEPAAIDTNMPPALVKLVDAINFYRNTLPEKTFTSVGQILQVRALTIESPWLNLTPVQQMFAINDTAYERLPQQILSLLKVGDPRFVIYAYGQSLKPARDSIDTSQGNICTNYQVTAEVATRAVIRVEGSATRPRTVIESFNILPPD